MRIGLGERWLRLVLLTPTHTGSSAGEAVLDRPTEKDAVDGLPFLPASALKGILAGARGDVPDEGEGNALREEVFGSPDRGRVNGRPSRLVLGEGELLALPLPTRDGSRALLVPAGNLARFLRLDPELGTDDPRLAGALALLGQIEAGGAEGASLLAPGRLPLDLPERLAELSGASVRRNAPALWPLLRRYAGGATADGWVVAPNAVAGRIFRSAAERRTGTALDRERRTVVAGSLRQVELIPAGSLLLSLVTLTRGEPVELGSPIWPIWIGAWEGLGCGAVVVEPVAGEVPEEAAPAGEAASAPPSPGGEEPRRMLELFEAVTALRQAADEPLRKAARAAIGNLGPRIRFGGLEAALAFELAKAKPRRPRPSAEARAHRWLLAVVLGLATGPPAEGGEARELLSWVETHPFGSAELAAREADVLGRWLWVARYAEVALAGGLPEPVEGAP